MAQLPEEWRHTAVLSTDPHARGTKYLVNGVTYSLNDNGERLRAWLSMAARQDFEIEEIVEHASNSASHRLVLCASGVVADLAQAEALVEPTTNKLKELFADDARAPRNASVLYLYRASAATLYAVCDTLSVSGIRTVEMCGTFVLGERFELHAQPIHPSCGRLPCANSGSTRAFALVRLSDGVRVQLDRDALEKKTSYYNREQRNGGATPVLDHNSANQRWSAEFKRHCERRRALVSRNEVEAVNERRQSYLDELHATRCSRIDLAAQNPVHNPSDSRVNELVIEAIKQDEGRYVFKEARAILDRVYAVNSMNKGKLWVKTRDPQGRVHVVEINEDTLKKQFSYDIAYPADSSLDEVIRAKIPGGLAKKRPVKFDFFAWYLSFGARKEGGTTFYPLGFGESLDEIAEGYINKFCGFRAHALLSAPGIMEQLDRIVTDPNDDLVFLLRHVCFLAGEDSAELTKIMNNGGLETGAGQFLGMLNNIMNNPRVKLPRYYIIQGPPGCGKSSFIVAFVKKLLNSAHTLTFTDPRRLRDEYNGHSDTNILTVLEEVNLNDLKSDGLRELQQLVTCAERYQRKLFHEGETVVDYRRFIICTNEQRPIILPPGQRRCWLLRFNQRIGQQLENHDWRAPYLARLNRVLDDDFVMTRFAHFLCRKYDSREQRRALELKAHTLRSFNFDTLQIQLDSLVNSKETSILGWLYKHLVQFDDLLAHIAHRSEYVIHPSVRRRLCTDNSFDPNDVMYWPTLEECGSGGKTPPGKFSGKWRDSTAGPEAVGRKFLYESYRTHAQNWWMRARASDFYRSYCGAVDRDYARLSENDFGDTMRALFCENDEKYLLVGSRPGCADEFWALAPLDKLEQAFICCVPNIQDFDWDAYREFRAMRRARISRSNVGLPPQEIR